GSANPTDSHYTPTIIQPYKSQPQKTKQHRKPRRKDTEVPQPSNPTEHVIFEAVNEDMDDSLERAATTATRLDAKQDRDGDEVIVETVDVVKQAKEVVDDITLAKALMEIKSEKPKADKVVIQEPEHGTTITTPTTITAASSRPKVKRLVIHEQEQAPTLTVSSQQPSQSKLVLDSSKKAKAEVTKGSSKRAGEELEKENAKK
nr:hypothetical protein [Tanacetum cinerariifolium]